MPALRRTFRTILLIGFVAVSSLILLELGLRLLDPFHTGEVRAREAFQRDILMRHPTRPEGGTVLRPDHRAEFLGDEYAIGEHGMRSPVVPRAKPAGTYRVLVVGDSIAFGWGVAEADCFPRVLERRLEAGGERPAGVDRFEVINGSCPGWGVPSYYLFCRDVGLAYDPDCVIVTFINNDLTDVISQLEGTRPSELMLLPGWSEPFYVAHAVKAVHDISVGAKGDFFLELGASEFTRPAIDALCDTGFRLIAELVAPRPFAVLDTVGNAEGESLQHFSERLDDLGIERIQAFLPMKNYAEEFAITPTDVHPNARGHEVFATEIYEWMRENVLH